MSSESLRSNEQALGVRRQATVGARRAPPSSLPPQASRLIHSARVAHFATADSSGQPHVIPICFVFDGERFYSPIDEKPKRTDPLKLKRLRNIKDNPYVSIVIDRYDENWRQLAWVLIFGTARAIKSGARYSQAVTLLRKKYPQYRSMKIDQRPIICIVPERVRTWSNG
jgi:PPOX class probable F420-dependent enzyme